MNQILKFCTICEGIAVYWDKCIKEWIALYVAGGYYCVCSEEELLGLKKKCMI